MVRSLLVALALTVVACSNRGVSDKPEGQDAPTPPFSTANPEPAPAASPAPAEVPLLSSRGIPTSAEGPSTSTMGPDGAINAAGLIFALPSTWTAVPPASSMRLAQAAIPGGGEFMVFHLGVGGGGGVDANLDRWVGQMDVTAGTTPQRERFEGNGLVVHLIDVVGTLLPSNMGTGPAEPQPNSRLIGAVIEGPGGPWFFKATGPGAALAAEREALLAMLRGARPSGA
ncbi:MAG: hypothetical protein KC933_41500 [Myxococcales bacterium]|nr:hypothetical protein [Myxococcales bacterium]